MGKPSAPAPPDPKATSAAQTGTNIGTTIASNMMGMVDQYNPYGSLNYDQTGTYVYNDPYTGETYDIPQYRAVQEFSPGAAAINDSNMQTQYNLAQAAEGQSDFLYGYLGQGFNPDPLPGFNPLPTVPGTGPRQQQTYGGGYPQQAQSNGRDAQQQPQQRPTQQQPHQIPIQRMRPRQLPADGRMVPPPIPDIPPPTPFVPRSQRPAPVAPEMQQQIEHANAVAQSRGVSPTENQNMPPEEQAARQQRGAERLREQIMAAERPTPEMQTQLDSQAAQAQSRGVSPTNDQFVTPAQQAARQQNGMVRLREMMEAAQPPAPEMQAQIENSNAQARSRDISPTENQNMSPAEQNARQQNGLSRLRDILGANAPVVAKHPAETRPDPLPQPRQAPAPRQPSAQKAAVDWARPVVLPEPQRAQPASQAQQRPQSAPAPQTQPPAGQRPGANMVGLDTGPAQGGPIWSAPAPRPVQSSIAPAGAIASELPQAGPLRNFYGPENFAENRSRVERALMDRMNPQIERDREALRTQMANSGISVGADAYSAANKDFESSVNDARLGAILAGGQEQSRIAGLERDQASFTNSAQQQKFGQNLAAGEFGNAAQQQEFGQNAAQQQVFNAAQQQAFGQGLASSGFDNAAQQQAFGQNRTNIDASNAARMAGTGFNNSVANTQFQQQMAQAGFEDSRRQQALQEQFARRNQPINEITALLSGAQVQSPNFAQSQPQQIPVTDVAGNIWNNYEGQMNNYNQQMESRNSMFGNIFGLAKAFI